MQKLSHLWLGLAMFGSSSSLALATGEDDYKAAFGTETGIDEAAEAVADEVVGKSNGPVVERVIVADGLCEKEECDPGEHEPDVAIILPETGLDRRGLFCHEVNITTDGKYQ